jgi:copper homeostasis protein (lipoprotein)
MKNLFLSLIIVGTLASCNRNNNNVQVVYDTIDADTALMPGVQVLGTIYQGILPCVDCAGINTMLTIIDDSTYSISETYKGVVSRDSVLNFTGKLLKTTGTATDPQAIVYQLMVENNQPSKFFKLVGDSSLQVLDVNKSEITSTGNMFLRRQ